MQKYRSLPVHLPLALLFVATLPAQAENLHKLETCRALTSNAERLDCYDKLTEPELQEADSPPPDSAPPPADNTVTAVTAQRAGGDEMDDLRANVTQILGAGPDRVQLILDNDQVWRQIDNSRLRLKEGDTIIIKKAAFGSFKLKKVGSNRSMRVKRVE